MYSVLARNLPRIAALIVENLDGSVFLGKGFDIAPTEASAFAPSPQGHGTR